MQRVRRDRRLTGRVEQTFVDHRFGAAGTLFARLEHEDDVAGQRRPGRRQSSRAAPTRPATCRSCPHACIAPGTSDAYGRSVNSCTGSASMSPRSSTVGPRPAAAQHGDDRRQVVAERDLQRQTVQRGQNLLLRTRQMHPDLGVPVQVAAQRDEVVADGFDGGHGTSSRSP